MPQSGTSPVLPDRNSSLILAHRDFLTAPGKFCPLQTLPDSCLTAAPTTPVLCGVSIHLSFSFYPIPIHSRHIFTAFAKTVCISPRLIPYAIIKIPAAAAHMPGQFPCFTSLIKFPPVNCFLCALVLQPCCFFYFKLPSSVSTTSFQSSRLRLPGYVPPVMFPSLSAKNVSGTASMPFRRPFNIPSSGIRNG